MYFIFLFLLIIIFYLRTYRPFPGSRNSAVHFFYALSANQIFTVRFRFFILKSSPPNFLIILNRLKFKTAEIIAVGAFVNCCRSSELGYRLAEPDWRPAGPD